MSLVDGGLVQVKRMDREDMEVETGLNTVVFSDCDCPLRG